MEEDEHRESIIKRSREVLKLSKNSIYAMHRGDVARAKEHIASAKAIAKADLLPALERFPTLRHGALRHVDALRRHGCGARFRS